MTEGSKEPRVVWGEPSYHLDHWHPLPGYPEPDWSRMGMDQAGQLIAEMEEDMKLRALGEGVPLRAPHRYPSRYWNNEGEEGGT